MDRQTGRLVPLRTLDGYGLAGDEVDIRGWPIVDAAGATLGTVEELLVDPERAEVGALLVGPSSALLPMERAHIDERRRVVHSDLAATELTPTMPANAPVSASVSASGTSGTSRTSDVAAHPGVTVERSADGEEVIRVPIVREELVVERRPVVKEVVVIRKRAVADERVVEADLRRERVEVDDRREPPPDKAPR